MHVHVIHTIILRVDCISPFSELHNTCSLRYPTLLLSFTANITFHFQFQFHFTFAFTANNTVQVDNTDAEGRLLLADALCYAHSFSPSTIIDLATLTGAIDVALGSGASAVFTTSDTLWSDLQEVLYNYMHNVYAVFLPG